MKTLDFDSYLISNARNLDIFLQIVLNGRKEKVTTGR